ncbi:hypothetical protein LSTR_LSTR000222 [Laodelphax striatellus]|uniref:Transmembrane protein 72 n=1 Tax=Laodelphax striatellus TaxID=195883 RepID=A0A482X7S0_LAOST|nr:hypothetical protein LSTR_LSTR000222 [Laodelphax striatellus]
MASKPVDRAFSPQKLSCGEQSGFGKATGFMCMPVINDIQQQQQQPACDHRMRRVRALHCSTTTVLLFGCLQIHSLKLTPSLHEYINTKHTISRIVLCGVGVDITAHHHTIGIYYVIGAIVVFFLEIAWAITLFLQVCVRNEYSPVLKCWSCVSWFNLWKRAVLYVGLATLLFLRPHRLWLSSVSAVQLLILASCYILLLFRTQNQTKHIPTLLHSQTPSQEDDRYDDLNAVLDETLPGPINADELDPEAVLEI